MIRKASDVLRAIELSDRPYADQLITGDRLRLCERMLQIADTDRRFSGSSDLHLVAQMLIAEVTDAGVDK